jgi:cation transport regulator ChaB
MIYELSYFSNGALPLDVTYGLPVYLRNFYMKLLIDIKTKEAESYKNDSPSTNKKIARGPF